MNCIKCNSERIAEITAKCSDCCFIKIDNNEHIGYLLDNLGIGGGDYIEFNWCLDCGQIQGKFPVIESELEKTISDEKVGEFFDYHFVPNLLIHDKRELSKIVDIARSQNDSLGNFLERFVTLNVDRLRRFPSREKFIEMYRSGDPCLGADIDEDF